MLIEDPKSNQVITNIVLKELKKSGYKKFTARPWNFYEAATSLWWLVPSTQWPSYKYGKIAIYREKEHYRIGIHVEKGISKEVADALAIPLRDYEKVILKEDWRWNNLLGDIKSGELQVTLDRITSEMRKPLKIITQLSDYNGPDSKVVKFEGLELDNSITFEFINGKLKCIEDQARGLMKKYINIDSTQRLVEILESKDNGWFWIDLYILFEIDEVEVLDPCDYAFCFIENYKAMFE